MRKVLLIAVLLSSCVTAKRFNTISTGMTKAEVIAKMGRPSRVASRGKTEYLIYELLTGSHAFWFTGERSEYFVRIINGQVESYGEVGDFNSTQNEAIDVNVRQR